MAWSQLGWGCPAARTRARVCVHLGGLVGGLPGVCVLGGPWQSGAVGLAGLSVRQGEGPSGQQGLRAPSVLGHANCLSARRLLGAGGQWDSPLVGDALCAAGEWGTSPRPGAPGDTRHRPLFPRWMRCNRLSGVSPSDSLRRLPFLLRRPPRQHDASLPSWTQWRSNARGSVSGPLSGRTHVPAPRASALCSDHPSGSRPSRAAGTRIGTHPAPRDP